MVCESQFVKINAFLAEAKAAGLNVLTGGGSPDRRGYYVSPTVFVDVPADADVWQKEVSKFAMLSFVLTCFFRFPSPILLAS